MNALAAMMPLQRSRMNSWHGCSMIHSSACFGKATARTVYEEIANWWSTICVRPQGAPSSIRAAICRPPTKAWASVRVTGRSLCVMPPQPWRNSRCRPQREAKCLPSSPVSKETLSNAPRHEFHALGCTQESIFLRQLQVNWASAACAWGQPERHLYQLQQVDGGPHGHLRAL